MRKRGLAAAGSLLLIGLVSIGGMLLTSQRVIGLGFPLDDAWIHQTYARNLAQTGTWAFLPGQPSAGSTSPLWTVLLTIGRHLRLEPRAWAYALGSIFLALTAWCCLRWIGERRKDAGPWGLAAAAIVLVEWHLVWAALSGMETIAQAFLGVLILWLLERRSTRPFWLGVLVGAGVWIRPDSLLLLIPIMGAALLTDTSASIRLRSAVEAVVGAALCVVPYLGFNHWLSGEVWPTTFYAKQAEYAVERLAPLWDRLAEQATPPLVGVGALMLVGGGWGAAEAARSRDWGRLLPWAWILAHLSAYACRLPVSYQHGRYAIPVLPALIVLGMDGMAGWVRLEAPGLARRVLSRTWLLAVPIVALVFWVLGARAYASDVAIIETEMVAAARWVAGNTPPDAWVAAHDIGALGYFAERPLIDLAGLISPQVIPILRDESALRDYLNREHADYLVTFPGWYPRLTARAEPVYVSDGRYSLDAGGETMAVYRWPTPE